MTEAKPCELAQVTFAGPKPAGPPQLLRAFASDQPTITQTGIRVEERRKTLAALG